MQRPTLDDAAVMSPSRSPSNDKDRERPRSTPKINAAFLPQEAHTAKSGHSSVASAGDAIEQGAVNRLRLYRIAMLTWCAGGLIGTSFTPGLFRDRVIAWTSVLLFTASYALRKQTATTAPSVQIRKMLPVALTQSIAGLGVNLALGLSSPFNGLIVVALCLYGLSAPRAHSRLVFGCLAGGYAVFSALVLADVLPGTGLLVPAPLPFWSKLANALWTEGTYATGFAVGVYARHDSVRLVEELERVVRESAHREALLREAREELARVARIGGKGPFSGVDLGQFRLGEVIGRGGMGEVYSAARRDGSPGEAAVKLLRRDVLSQPDMVRRFEREARIAQSIQSPHIVEVYEVGGVDAPLPYIAMERLKGEDLVTSLRSRTVLPPSEVKVLIHELCDGLRVAHQAGVVHRDLKPANLFLAEVGEGARCWKILDFGVSKILQASDATLTTNEVLGTPHYMSPEQAARRPVDARTDLYGVGAIAYRALTGKLPFPKSDVSEVIRSVLDDMPEDPRALAQLAEDVTLWLRVALAKRPDDRFSNAREMAVAFDAALEGQLPEQWRQKARALLSQQAWGARRSSTAPPEGATRYA